MRALTHSRTFVYYDGPQLFEARDQVGSRFVCMLIDERETTDRYLCVPISEGRLEQLAAGDLDLRGVLETAETGEAYEGVAIAGNLEEIEIQALPSGRIPEEWLPDKGFTLEKPAETRDLVEEEARNRGRAVMHLRLSPPESLLEPKISAEHLSQAIKQIQRLVTHAYRRALRDMTVTVRELVSTVENYRLEVFNFSPGSFTVHLQSSIPADLVGYSPISRAFEIIDSVSLDPDDPQKVLEAVSTYGGHFATAYKDFVRFLADNETPVAYEWSMPERRLPSRRNISASQAKDIYKVLSAKVGLGEEERRIVGRLTKVDEKLGTWRLRSDDEKRDYSGGLDPDSTVSLAGLVIETRIYEFVCNERLEEEAGSGRELTKFDLKEYRPI